MLTLPTVKQQSECWLKYASALKPGSVSIIYSQYIKKKNVTYFLIPNVIITSHSEHDACANKTNTTC